MGSLTSKPKSPKIDTSGQQRQEKLLADQDARLKAQEAAQTAEEEERKRKEAASSRARKGRAGGDSLLAGLETGIAPVEGGRRTQLG